MKVVLRYVEERHRLDRRAQRVLHAGVRLESWSPARATFVILVPGTTVNGATPVKLLHAPSKYRTDERPRVGCLQLTSDYVRRRRLADALSGKLKEWPALWTKADIEERMG